MTDRVSVIIPTWNRASSLGGAIRSALAQTVPVAEILVCDDGSTDESRSVVSDVGDERVKWLAGEHTGLPASPRNRGISAASSEWLAFLDSDDLWYPDKIEKQLDLARQTGCKAVCSDALRIIPNHGEQGLLLGLDCERIVFDRLLEENRVICSSVLVRATLVSGVGGFPESINLRACEDYALWLRISTITDFAAVCEPLVRYTDAPQLSIRKDDNDPLKQKLAVLDDFIRWSGKQTGDSYLKKGCSKKSQMLREIRRNRLSALLEKARRWFG